MALLALLAGTRHHILARDKLIGLLWPETDTASARGLLSASVHTIRKVLGDDVLLSEGEAVRLDPARLRIDALEFETALDANDVEGAVAWRSGPFLDGFSIPDAVEFDQWMDGQRDRLERRYHAALERLAEQAATRGDPAAAAEWWRRRVACSPADGRVVVRLMQALVEAGDRGGALQVAAAHGKHMKTEFGATADPVVPAFEDRLRRPPTIAALQDLFAASPEARKEPAAAKAATQVRSLRLSWFGSIAWVFVCALILLSLAVAVLRSRDPAKPGLRSIIVLPLLDRSAERSQDGLGDAIADALRVKLGGIASLRVVSGTSTARFKGSTERSRASPSSYARSS